MGVITPFRPQNTPLELPNERDNYALKLRFWRMITPYDCSVRRTRFYSNQSVHVDKLDRNSFEARTVHVHDRRKVLFQFPIIRSSFMKD